MAGCFLISSAAAGLTADAWPPQGPSPCLFQQSAPVLGMVPHSSIMPTSPPKEGLTRVQWLLHVE